MRFHIISLFPGAFDSYLNESIISRAIEDKKIKVEFYNPRDYSDDKWKRVDQKPYSGGPGMVIQALPTAKAIEKAFTKIKRNKKAKTKIIFFSPEVNNLQQPMQKMLQKSTQILFLCVGDMKV
jgi:tRNA (guanine37-N1)-methyltransferase